MNAFVALIYLAVLGGVFAIIYTANKKTPVPAGCEDLKVDCEGCRDISCGNNPAQNK